MYCDLEGERRLNRLMQMFLAMSEQEDPSDTLDLFRQGTRELYGDLGVVSLSVRGLQRGWYRIMRRMDATKFADTRPQLDFAGPEAPAQSGGFIGELVSAGRPSVIRNLDVPDDPVLSGFLEPYRMALALPIINGGEVTNWVIFVHERPDAFNQDQVEMRYVMASLLGGLTDSKRLTQELRQATSWIQREVDEIASIQRELLPGQMPRVPGLNVAAFYQTYDRAGGDYYDVLPITGSSHWGIFIADVAGHGPSAAVVTAMLSTLLRTHCEDSADPAGILREINRRFLERHVQYSFATAFFGIYDPASRSLRYTNAGHNVPLIRNGTANLAGLSGARGIPLGVREEAHYTNAEITLPRGATLALYTDGLTEARSRSGAMWGDEGLCRAFMASDGSVKGALEAIISALREHEDGTRPEDDQTLLVVRTGD